MAGDTLIAKPACDLEPGDYLFVGSAERSFLVETVRPATIPGSLLVTLDTGTATWTMPLDGDDSILVEMLS